MQLAKPEKEGEATMNSLLEASARSGEIYFVERIFDLGKSKNLKFDIDFAISMARTMEIANFFVQKGGDLSTIGKPLKLKLISAESSGLDNCEYPYRRRPMEDFPYSHYHSATISANSQKSCCMQFPNACPQCSKLKLPSPKPLKQIAKT